MDVKTIHNLLFLPHKYQDQVRAIYKNGTKNTYYERLTVWISYHIEVKIYETGIVFKQNKRLQTPSFNISNENSIYLQSRVLRQDNDYEVLEYFCSAILKMFMTYYLVENKITDIDRNLEKFISIFKIAQNDYQYDKFLTDFFIRVVYQDDDFIDWI